MTAQPEHSADPRVTAVPHTINGIGDALTGAERARFYTEVLAAEENEVPAAMRRWWKVAMLHGAPAAAQSRANAAAGSSLVSVEELLVDGPR
ncbi:hypothetical protein [Streptomyces sp. NBC_01363]|uniref:hypothetical protein n=1 Tax=Streptomyces sp. NBC_01363 TaxID=2903840 RepID=UPI002253E18A|nr:hypothetical protein [Streptomyces sp. NBC_01363]MCX4736826.1 hypothetical protein [Streptomyces sp. NBC_01363]